MDVINFSNIDDIKLTPKGYSINSSPFERMYFVEQLHSNYATFEKFELLKYLLYILKHDNNEVVRHEAVFLLGMLQEYFAGSEDLIVSRLTDEFCIEKSTVLCHEIIETLGFYSTQQAISFVEKYINSPIKDIADTAIISLERQNKAIAEQHIP